MVNGVAACPVVVMGIGYDRVGIGYTSGADPRAASVGTLRSLRFGWGRYVAALGEC